LDATCYHGEMFKVQRPSSRWTGYWVSGVALCAMRWDDRSGHPPKSRPQQQ